MVSARERPSRGRYGEWWSRYFAPRLATRKPTCHCDHVSARGTRAGKDQMLTYQESIRRDLQSTRDLRLMTVDPRHVEAYMRLTYSTLDGLSRVAFRAEAISCAETVLLDPEAEELALSYAL